MLDTNIGNGAVAEACICNCTGYFGFAMTEDHRDQVMKRFTMFMLSQMASEGSRLYDAKWQV